MKKYILYKFFYGNDVVYFGRTAQPLQNRIRGHVFGKPMHRIIDINQVTKIEYTELPTEADMFLYEIYYINKLKPCLNLDDRAYDDLTVALPELKFSLFETKLWDKWKKEINLRHGRELAKRRLEIERRIEIAELRKQGIFGEDLYTKIEEINKRNEKILADMVEE